jgi:ADP-ribose pyrophosphatase
MKSKKRYLDFICKEDETLNQNAPFTIIRDPVKIEEIEEMLQKQGQDESYFDNFEIGIVYEDRYLCIFRDAVVFPNGQMGTYVRCIKREKDPSGVVVLPYSNKKIIILEHFRHATRDWHLEIPRGFGEPGVTNIDNAKRELKEEIQSAVASISFLGDVYTNTGISSELVSFYFAQVTNIGQPEKNEGIRSTLELDVKSMEDWILKGKINDSFTIVAFYLAKGKGLFE